MHTCYAAVIDSAPIPVADDKGLSQKLKVGGLFGLWYILNIGYNIYNKKVLNLVPELTYSIGFLQLFLGLFYVIPIWALGIRKTPVLNSEELKNLIPVAVLHTLTHLGAVVSLGAGAVSFTHIVKAAEPAGRSIGIIYTCIVIDLIINNNTLKSPPHYLQSC